ncbi:4776_t:CDS:2 [Cetraspora pellucida]|uniref:4776_t:CDS:1 n=1 Tax=Cetraspora pellucida TaxID=1433469 RepID=A0A9N9BTL2_9GLOM|nr:4776_t:CDS:2 [Cetraspora pellucida]
MIALKSKFWDVSVNDAVVAAAISKLKELLKEYDLKDIYNMDKTSLEPNTTLATKCLKGKKKI